MRNLIIIRRIVGDSMTPTLMPGKIVLGSGFYKKLKKGDLIVFEHQAIDKIKRIQSVDRDKLYVVGDNATASKDSRTFGWIESTAVKARVIWPKS